MRGIIAALAGAIGFVWCGAAAAQVNGAAVAGYCTSSGAFGEQFGATAVNGQRGQSLPALNALFVGVSSFPPFTDVEVVFTDDTRRVHNITGIATFASETDAQAAYAAAVRAFDQDQRFVRQPSGDDEAAAYYSDDASTAGFRANLWRSGSTLMLACVDGALSRSARTEWTENFGLGATPPAAPALTQDWDAAAIAQQQCTPTGAFGLEFGRRLRGRSRQGLTEFNRILTSPPAHPPFQHFEASITPRGRVVHNITARAAFADARAATAAYDALVAAYDASGRLPHRGEDQLISGPAGTVSIRQLLRGGPGRC